MAEQLLGPHINCNVSRAEPRLQLDVSDEVVVNAIHKINSPKVKRLHVLPPDTIEDKLSNLMLFSKPMSICLYK